MFSCSRIVISSLNSAIASIPYETSFYIKLPFGFLHFPPGHTKHSPLHNGHSYYISSNAVFGLMSIHGYIKIIG